MKIIKFVLFFFILLSSNSLANNEFNEWVNKFSERAIKKGISKDTIDKVLKNVKFLPNVIKYDRYQPEFYEDTKTYIEKRVNQKKIKKGFGLYHNNRNLIDEVEKKFSVEKELLLALMGIETNYGNYLGKMDIVSSLATLGFDKRRSEFFTNELLTVLSLVDKGLIDHQVLFGSWAGAFGNFQFMPTTIEKYAIDYDNDNKIDLKSMNDSFASAANYINKIGWKTGKPCFKKINLKKQIPNKFLNSSARAIKHKRKLKYYKKYITNYDSIKIFENYSSAIITPDKDIVDNPNLFSPAYIVFDNYELILKWNRSLRFALAVCTLKENFSNEL